jgi:hypothetical protein
LGKSDKLLVPPHLKTNYDWEKLMRELWASKTYRTLFFAGFISELGTYVSEVAPRFELRDVAGDL